MTVITNIAEIVTASGNRPLSGSDQGKLEIIEGKSIVIENGIIKEITGKRNFPGENIIDAEGGTVIPGLIDSHTHVVYSGTREDEFYLRIKKVSYEDLLKSGNGIYNTIRNVTKANKDTIFAESIRRVKDAVSTGTTTMEIKTGYGLTLENEEKLLSVISMIGNESFIDAVPTHLLHVVPEGYSEKDYVKYSENMINKFRNRINFVDIFCDSGAFSPESAAEIARYAEKINIKMRMHANEIANTGCIKSCRNVKIFSADHLIHTDDEDLEILKEAGSIAAFLPATVFTLGEDFPDMRKFIEKGIPVVIASDASPLNYSTNLLFSIYLAVTHSGISVEEAIVAVTLNAAYSLGCSETKGTIEAGKIADFAIIDLDDYRKIPYEYGKPTVSKTVKNGKVVFDKNKSYEM
ncbi:MAG: imidazolonepropionase [Thermoplasmata archaeon]